MTDPNLVAEAVRELYGSPTENFVALRKAWVLKARAAKDREAATTIGALRKPTRSADLLNQLTQAEPAAIDDLLHLGSDLRRAQRTADAPRLRELTARRRELVGELLRLISRFDGEVTPGIRDEITATLGAALVDDDVALGLRSGTLTKAGSWDGFGPGVSAQLSVVRSPTAADSPPVSATATDPSATDPSLSDPTAPKGEGTTDEAEAGQAEAGPHENAPHRSGLRLVTSPPDDGATEDGAADDRTEQETDDDPEPSDRQLRDLSRAEARRLTREEEHRRRESAQAEIASLEQRRAAQRTRREDQARLDARRRLDQAVAAHQLARAGLDDLDAQLQQARRQVENLQQDRDDQEELADRTERAVTRARAELDRLGSEPS